VTIPSETRVFNTLFATTMDIYAEQAAVNTLTSTPLLDKLYRGGNAAVKPGGVRIDVGVRYGMNPGSQWYQGADVLDMTPFESNTTAKYDWKQLHLPVTYTGEEVRKNRGEAQMLDLVQEKIAASQLTAKKVVDIAMCADGTANGGKVILGLEALVSDAPTADPTVGAIGGITAVGNPWWQNSAVTSFGSWAANGPNGSSTDLFVNAWNTVSDGSDSPTMIYSAQDVYEFYHATNLAAVQIIMTQNATGTMSFPTLKYMGVDWNWSRNIASGEAYLLRPDQDLAFWVHSEGNFRLSPFQKAWNQDLFGASLLLMSAFFIRRRMFSMRITGVSA
jgi:hypothetical protein